MDSPSDCPPCDILLLAPTSSLSAASAPPLRALSAPCRVLQARGLLTPRRVTYTPPHDQQTARRKQKARAEEWIKSEDGITETMTGPNGVYTRFVSTSPPESEQDDAASIGYMRSHD